MAHLHAVAVQAHADPVEGVAIVVVEDTVAALDLQACPARITIGFSKAALLTASSAVSQQVPKEGLYHAHACQCTT